VLPGVSCVPSCRLHVPASEEGACHLRAVRDIAVGEGGWLSSLLPCAQLRDPVWESLVSWGRWLGVRPQLRAAPGLSSVRVMMA
jgi:hypothetical protein